MTKYVHVKAQPPAADTQQAQTAKIARLRGLRLEKEAAERDAGIAGSSIPKVEVS